MKNIIIIGLFAAAGYYFYNQSSTCTTEEDVMEKYFELMRQMQSSSISNSNSQRKVQNLIQKFESLKNSNDPQSTCDAIDEIMNEL